MIDDYGPSSARCDEALPFICEKDPVFLGAAFRYVVCTHVIYCLSIETQFF